MKFWKVLPWITTIILAILLFSGGSETKYITIPSEEGTFKTEKPIPVQVTELPVKEIETFSKLPEVQKTKVYAEAVKPRVYREVFRDSVQEITVEVHARGVVDSIKVDYKTAPKVIPIRQKTRASLFLGMEARLNQYERPTVEPKLHIINDDTMFSAGYDLRNKVFNVGVAWKLSFRKKNKQ